MPNNVRPDLYPDDVHCLPPRRFERPRESAVLGALWEDFGDPDFPESTAAIYRFVPRAKKQR